MLVYATVDGETQVIRVDTGSIDEARHAVGSHILLDSPMALLNGCRILVVVK